jgi:hypothetical protein
MSAELRLDGRVASSGAGQGLGRAHALALAAPGARVVVNDLGGGRTGERGGNVAAARAMADEIVALGGYAIADGHSVATPQSAALIVTRAIDTWGRLDIVVNNAGITGQGAFAPPKVWQRVVATHLFGTVDVLRAAWPHFTAQGYGRVVSTASSSFLGTPQSGDYARGWLERHFEPEKMAAFVVYLCHDTLEVSGETFIAGGGRAARVLFETTRGWFEPEPSPESFRDHFDAVMAGDDARAATSGQGDLVRYAELLGDPGPFAASA